MRNVVARTNAAPLANRPGRVVRGAGPPRRGPRPGVRCAPDDSGELPTQTVVAPESNVPAAVGMLQTAVDTAYFDAGEICESFRALEKEKMEFEDLNSAVGGGPDGKFWCLQFASEMKHLKKGAKPGGIRFPLCAIQHFDNGSISNGIYLGHLASVQFMGTYETKGSMLKFAFEKLQLQLGPGRFTFPVGSGSTAEGRFVFFYADEKFVVARGQSGGTAFWMRISPSERLKLGAA